MLSFPKKESIDALQALLNLGMRALLAVGLLLLVAYFASEGIFPDGFSLGDAFVMLYCAISFSFVMSIGTLYGAITTYWFVCVLVWSGNFIQTKRNRPHASFIGALTPGWPGVVGSVLTFACFAYVGWTSPSASDMRLVGTLLFFMMYGFLLTCAFGVVPPLGRGVGWRVGALLVVGTLFLAANVGKPALLNFSMGIVGLRSFPGDTVVVQRAEKEAIDKITNTYGFTSPACPISGTEQWVLANARVVWHGVGATSYVRVFEAKQDDPTSVLIPFEKMAIKVIKRDRARLACQPK